MIGPPSPHPSPRRPRRRGEGVACGARAARFADLTQPGKVKPASRSAIAGWVLFEWAVQPFFTLITTFVYAPYFAAAVVGDPTRGQALWGFATGAAGLVIALLSPALGAIADAAGSRKPWIAGFSTLLLGASALLWFGKPADASSIVPVLGAFALGAVGAQCALVFFNSMMPALVPAERLGRLSGTAWGVAYVGGLISLVVTLGLLAASPVTGKTLLGFAPIFGLDPLSHEGDRATGPFTALWLLAFAWPLFAFTPDRPRQRGIRDALRSGLATLAHTLRHLPRERDLALFLLANMICADGLVALFAFGGIYAAGTFGWGRARRPAWLCCSPSSPSARWCSPASIPPRPERVAAAGGRVGRIDFPLLRIEPPGLESCRTAPHGGFFALKLRVIVAAATSRILTK